MGPLQLGSGLGVDLADVGCEPTSTDAAWNMNDGFSVDSVYQVTGRLLEAV